MCRMAYAGSMTSGLFAARVVRCNARSRGLSMPQSRLIGIIALVTWLLVALPLLLYHGPAGFLNNWPWSAVVLIFGALFALDLRRPHLSLLSLDSAAALVLDLVRCSGYEGALLALVPMQLAPRVDRAAGIAW